MPSRSPSGDRMQWPEPANTEQRKAPCAPYEGRCRADPHCTRGDHSGRPHHRQYPDAGCHWRSRRQAATSLTRLTGDTSRRHAAATSWWPTAVSPPITRSLDRKRACCSTSTPALVVAPWSPPGARRTAPQPPARSGCRLRPPRRPAPAGPVDTVTPDQRAAWERVAMCEEGGNWHADGSTFSGGLGISRANWVAYGGRRVRPRGSHGHRGPADHGGRAHPAQRPGPVRLPRLVDRLDSAPSHVRDRSPTEAADRGTASRLTSSGPTARTDRGRR